MSLQTLLFKFMCWRNDTHRDEGLTVPSNVKCFTNIRYGKDKKYHLMDIYIPKKHKGRLPVIVSFHGGGWIYGTKETYKYYCMSLAEQGFAVVNPSYRLAPRDRFPAAFRDINKVFGYILKYHRKYGFDTGNIFGIGDSSGATGIAMYAAALTNPAFAEKFPVKTPKGLKLRGLGLNFGLFRAVGNKQAFVNILPKENADETLPLFHVPDHITADFPPCYVMTAVNDFNKEEQEILTDALEKHGVNYVYRVYGSKKTPLGHVFHCNLKDENAVNANKEEIDFLKGFIE